MVLASRDGKIVCENTLDARLDVVFRKKLPEVNFLCIVIHILVFVSSLLDICCWIAYAIYFHIIFKKKSGLFLRYLTLK